MYSLYCLSLTFHYHPSHIFPKYRYMGNQYAACQDYAPADVPFCLQLYLDQVKDPDAKKKKKRCALVISIR